MDLRELANPLSAYQLQQAAKSEQHLKLPQTIEQARDVLADATDALTELA